MSRYCLSRVLMVTAVVSCITISSAASAATLYEETFDIDVANTAAFTAQYSDWTVNGTDPLTVVGGVVTIPDNGANDTTTATRPGFAGEVIISADISALSSNGNYNVGLVVGGNTVVFHPGFAGLPGALRVGGTSGFGNQDMGFVPANGTLHHVEVHQFPTGQFDITVTDGDNPVNVYTNSWTNLASVGGPI